MKTIIKFQAADGTEFTDQDKCAEYELKCMAVEAIMANFPTPPKNCDFSNGGGYIQHDKDNFLKVRRELLQQAASEFTHPQHIEMALADESVSAAWPGRIISECCCKALNAAWWRIMRVDDQLREWGQPYFANHPNDGRQRRLNP